MVAAIYGPQVVHVLAAAGQSGYAQMMEQQVRLGDELRLRLQSADWEIVNSGTPLPVICTRDASHAAAHLGDAEMRENEYYETMCAEIVSRGRVWISTTHIQGRPALRACLTSYLTTSDDLNILVNEMNAVREASFR